MFRKESDQDEEYGFAEPATGPAQLPDVPPGVSGPAHPGRRLKGFEKQDCHYGAPALVLVTNQESNICALQDAACAMENMMLAASAVGVGSCWINQPYHLRKDEEMQALLTELGAQPGEFPCCSLALGLPEGPLFPGRREHTGNAVTWITGEKNS